MKKLILLLFSFGWIISITYSQSQPYEPQMEQRIFPILKNGEKVVLAAGQTTAAYPPITGEQLSVSPHNNQQYSHPEFLVLDFFLAVKNTDLETVTSLYETSSQAIIRDKLNIAEAANAYNDFPDIRLLSKAQFGDYLKIRYDMMLPDGMPRPWVLMVHKNGDQYNLTENVPLDHLFIDISSVCPFNYSREEFQSVDTFGMSAFYFTANELSLTPTNSWQENDLAVFIEITQFGSDNNTEQSAKELLLKMKSSLSDSTYKNYINLWDEKSRDLLQHSTYAWQQLEIQSSFFKKVSKLNPVGLLLADEELVLFYFSEINNQQGEMQLLPMRLENNKWRLTKRLSNYYAWQILNEPIVKKSIENQFIKQ